MIPEHVGIGEVTHFLWDLVETVTARDYTIVHRRVNIPRRDFVNGFVFFHLFVVMQLRVAFMFA
tara:strand:+ start:857 stop:1048 length:192 start_codon:yes stop_codon:yes gene_type:complete